MLQSFRGDRYTGPCFNDVEDDATHVAATTEAAELLTNSQGGESHPSRQRQDVWLTLTECRDTDLVGLLQENLWVVYSDLVALSINRTVGNLLGDHSDSKESHKNSSQIKVQVHKNSRGKIIADFLNPIKLLCCCAFPASYFGVTWLLDYKAGMFPC